AAGGRHDDEMSGTVTLGKGEAIVSVIVSPATTGVLGSGLCCRTVPAGFALCLVGGGSTTTRRRPSSWDLAASKVLPVTSGSWNACAASLFRRTCARRYPPAASRPKINRPIRTPSQTLRDEPSGSGGGSTWVGAGRAITCVASPATAPARMGVASAS